VSGLCKTRASCFIVHCERVTLVGGSSRNAGLSGERESAPLSQRLPRRQSELARQGRCVAAMGFVRFAPRPRCCIGRCKFKPAVRWMTIVTDSAVISASPLLSRRMTCSLYHRVFA